VQKVDGGWGVDRARHGALRPRAGKLFPVGGRRQIEISAAELLGAFNLPARAGDGARQFVAHHRFAERQIEDVPAARLH
jgi:hypothetical protein